MGMLIYCTLSKKHFYTRYSVLAIMFARNSYLMFSPKRRTINAPPVEIGAFERELLRALHHYRLLEWRQIQDLFGAVVPNTKHLAERVELLFRNAYIEEVPRPLYPSEADKGAVYRLGSAGALLLSGQQRIPFADFAYWGKGDDKDRRKNHVSSLFLEHTIALTDIRIALEQSAVSNGCSFERWDDDYAIRRSRDWPHVHIATTSGRHEQVSIRPDGYVVLAGPQGHAHFFLECDRSTESIARRWQRKILGYKELILSGAFNRYFNVDRAATPLRILTTTPSLARAQNLKRAAETYGPPEAHSLFLFAPLSDLVSHDVLSSPIWLRAGYSDLQSILYSIPT